MVYHELAKYYHVHCPYMHITQTV